MAKPRQKLKFRLPEYVTPRNAWRKEIHAVALKAAKHQRVEYGPEVKLYLHGRALEIHDVDNRLKDILDALQGRMGGSKAVRKFEPIILNDRQIYRVTITKSVPPKQSLGLGHVAVQRLGFSGARVANGAGARPQSPLTTGEYPQTIHSADTESPADSRRNKI